jgi:cell division protein FtsB
LDYPGSTYGDRHDHVYLVSFIFRMSFQSFLQSRLGTIVLGCGLVFVLFITAKLLMQKNEVEREIKELRAKSEEINKQNQDLSQLINYFNTETYKERQAREQLNLKKEGEYVVVLPKQDSADLMQTNAEKISNPRKWFNYFFAN